MNSFVPPYPLLCPQEPAELRVFDRTEAAQGGVVPFVDDDPLAPAAFSVFAPPTQTVPLVVASPHSGSYYPAAFLQQSKLDPHTLRRSEDAHVDRLFAQATELGAPLLVANFPRAYLDPNREPYELDPAMFDGPLPPYANSRTPRVLAGLGTLARMVANGTDIYRGKLPVSEAEHRIQTCYRPYHTALGALVERTRQAFGYCIVLDCHSMPSGLLLAGGGGARRRPLNDIVLGDCHGTSCARTITGTAHRVLVEQDLRVTRNTPYAGGFTTRHYGRPSEFVHCLQVEISRHLYMNESSYAPLVGFGALSDKMRVLMQAVAALSLEDCHPPPEDERRS